MTDSNILSELACYLGHLKCLSVEIIRRRNAGLADAILNRTRFLPKGTRISERLYCIANGMSERPVCPVCRSGFLKFNRRKKIIQ